MIRDKASELSSAQSLVGAAGTFVSTNYLDTEVAGGDVAVGEEVDFCFEIGAAVDSATNNATVTFQLFTDDDSAFGTEVKVFDSGALAEATLVAGYRVNVKLPYGLKRYLRAKYVTAGAAGGATAGTVTAGVVKETNHWQAAPAVGWAY